MHAELAWRFTYPLCISGWLSVRNNRQCLYKQDATSHTKSCTCIYSVVIPIHLNREMAVYIQAFLIPNMKYTVHTHMHTYICTYSYMCTYSYDGEAQTNFVEIAG